MERTGGLPVSNIRNPFIWISCVICLLLIIGSNITPIEETKPTPFSKEAVANNIGKAVDKIIDDVAKAMDDGKAHVRLNITVDLKVK